MSRSRWFPRSFIASLLFACTANALFFSSPAIAKERQNVTISYMLKPSENLPDNVKTVAVIDSGVQSDEEKNSLREKRWSHIGADMIEAMLNSQSNGPDSRVTVVNRRVTKQILAEQDMQLAGLVEADTASKVGKLLAVQGLITSKMTIHVDVRKRSKTRIDWIGILGGGGSPQPRYRNQHREAYGQRRPGAYQQPEFGTKEVEEISRNLTLQCSFSLVDATTGKTIIQYAPPVFQKKDKKSPNFFYGRYIDEADLDPVDHFIGELVEQAARDFVSMIAPVRVQYTYEVLGKSKHGEAAVRALRADNYEMAMREFEEAHRDKPDRDENVFGLGVVCELTGHPDKALEYYRQACSMPDVDEDNLPTYLAAKDRLTHQLGRIVPGNVAPLPAEHPVTKGKSKKSHKDDDDDD